VPLENIEEAHPTVLPYEEGADGISYLGLKNISGNCMPPKDDMLADYNQT